MPIEEIMATATEAFLLLYMNRGPYGGEDDWDVQSKPYCYRSWVANSATCDMVSLKGWNLLVC